jgi:hypothetical protein
LAELLTNSLALCANIAFFGNIGVGVFEIVAEFFKKRKYFFKTLP